MALASTTVWECGSTATANCVNGGGYNASRVGATTDYSQQDTAHLTITDLQSDFVDFLKVHSDLTPFDANDVGNILHITAGTSFTVGWYEITAVDGSTPPVATLDRTCGGTNLSGGTAYLGGAISLSSANDNTFFNVPVSGNTIWIKYGTYTMGASVTLPTSGSITLPKIIKGYYTARGDAPADTYRPTLNFGTSYYFQPGYYGDVYNLIFIGSNSSVVQPYYYNRFLNCKMTNNSTTAGRYAVQTANSYNILINCEMSSYRGTGFYNTNTTEALINCYIHDCNIGVYSNNPIDIYGCLVESCVTTAIQMGSTINWTIMGNTLYGAENTIGTGILLAAGSGLDLIYNNIIYGFAYGITHGTSGNLATILDYNNFYNNDTNVTNVVNGTNDKGVNPAFASVTQITGTTAYTAATGLLVDTTKNFTTLGVVANQSCVYIVSGTGVTAGIYLVTAITTTTNPNDTLTCYCGTTAISTNATADKVYQITAGKNFALTIGSGCIDVGFPNSTTWMGGSKI